MRERLRYLFLKANNYTKNPETKEIEELEFNPEGNYIYSIEERALIFKELDLKIVLNGSAKDNDLKHSQQSDALG